MAKYTPQTVYYTGQRGTALSMTVYEADVGTRGSVRFKKWDVCPMCGLEYPEDQFVRVGGKRLCIPSGCYRDGETGR